MTIRLDQPPRWDLVGNPILIGGIGTGFEATINFRVHEGHDEVTGFINVGGGTGERARASTTATRTSSRSCAPTSTRSTIPT